GGPTHTRGGDLLTDQAVHQGGLARTGGTRDRDEQRDVRAAHPRKNVVGQLGEQIVLKGLSLLCTGQSLGEPQITDMGSQRLQNLFETVVVLGGGTVLGRSGRDRDGGAPTCAVDRSLRLGRGVVARDGLLRGGVRSVLEPVRGTGARGVRCGRRPGHDRYALLIGNDGPRRCGRCTPPTTPHRRTCLVADRRVSNWVPVCSMSSSRAVLTT